MDTQTVNIERMPGALWRQVKAMAASKGMTLRSAVAEALRDWLKQKGK